MEIAGVLNSSAIDTPNALVRRISYSSVEGRESLHLVQRIHAAFPRDSLAQLFGMR